jgi:1-acyl-sn-glycerol-3-phosphate acyltransferase
MAEGDPDSDDRRSLLARLFDRVSDPSWGRDPHALDPETLRRTLKRLGRVFGPRKYFRLSVKGWDNVPPPPVLIVANHSGGTSIPDVWGLGYSWYDHFSMDRPIHPLAHDMVFALKMTAEPFSKLGILRASRGMGMKILSEYKRDMIVMPGGDVETWRPYKDRYRVRWSGRTGYARLALKAGVPIVPIACAGAHSTLRVLTDGRRFAKAVGLKKVARSEVFPIHLSFPWGLGIGPLPHIPTPAHFRYRIGEPIVPIESIEVGEEPSMAQVRAHDKDVRRAMQGLLDVLQAEE